MKNKRIEREAQRQGWVVCLFFFMLLCEGVSAGEILIVERRVYLDADTLKLDIQFESLFSQRALDAIESGMTTSISLELQLGSRGRSRILEHTLGIQLDHDIWEGRYRTIRRSVVPDTLWSTDFQSAERSCSVLKEIALGVVPASNEELVLRARVGVNPISPEQLRRTRRWLNFLERASLLEFFVSLDRPIERTNWIEIGRFSLKDLQ